MVATPVDTLLQIPPVTALLKSVEEPEQTEVVPVIAASGFTVTVAVVTQPDPRE
jgi:hypothetical protein